MNKVKTNIIAHLYLSSKSTWDSPCNAIRNYQEMPDDIAEFIGFLQHNSID